jgi:DNA polymerase III alpha subunit
MNYDKFGQAHVTANELVSLLYQNPDLRLERFSVTDPDMYNRSVDSMFVEWNKLEQYLSKDISVEEFDQLQQSNWHMPSDYSKFDIAQWVLDQCVNEAELQRAGEELLRFQELDLFDLLRYLKYLVDTLRQNNVVWGVGRGSSVSSFVLYKIGVHRINSLYYDLDHREFLK